ncbi:unnamed protein product [Calypogeia fissa]
MSTGGCSHVQDCVRRESSGLQCWNAFFNYKGVWEWIIKEADRLILCGLEAWVTMSQRDARQRGFPSL